MKPFEVYQALPNMEMTERDKLEENSPFWNKGKWDNYVFPFLPKECKQKTFVDMGCNSGLFLKYAEDMGFSRVIGIDSNRGAVERGIKWRDDNGGKYEVVEKRMEDSIDELPIADYTILVNSHYYQTINDWLYYLDRLKHKTQYCIIVTAEKKHINRCWALADVPSIRRYFGEWEEVGFIDELPLEGANPRRMWSLCFKSKFLDKTPIEKLDASNHVQDTFLGELDRGKNYKDTKYYWIIKRYRKKWSEDRLNRWFEERIKNYQDIKKNGLRVPIIVDEKDLILDGNHRYAVMRHLGFKEIFIRRT